MIVSIFSVFVQLCLVGSRSRTLREWPCLLKVYCNGETYERQTSRGARAFKRIASSLRYFPSRQPKRSAEKCGRKFPPATPAAICHFPENPSKNCLETSFFRSGVEIRFSVRCDGSFGAALCNLWMLDTQLV